MNLYAYTGANPVNATDPSGNVACVSGGAGFSGCVGYTGGYSGPASGGAPGFDSFYAASLSASTTSYVSICVAACGTGGYSTSGQQPGDNVVRGQPIFTTLAFTTPGRPSNIYIPGAVTQTASNQRAALQQQIVDGQRQVDSLQRKICAVSVANGALQAFSFENYANLASSLLPAVAEAVGPASRAVYPMSRLLNNPVSAAASRVGLGLTAAIGAASNYKDTPACH
jgi:hypothetical protein